MRFLARARLFLADPKLATGLIRLKTGQSGGLAYVTPQEKVVQTGLRPPIIYLQQYRLRQHFGVESSEALLEVIQGVFEDTATALAKP